jgi:ribosomal protein S18 acetylase RimI-like enzyme
MGDLPEALFLNPVWHALQGPHRTLALGEGLARRYPADVAPFAALAEPSSAAFEALRGLLAPHDPVWVVDEPPPSTPGLALETSLPCLQMALSADARLPPPASLEIVALTGNHAGDMVALTDVAFPGFFRPGTYRMGSYFGVREAGALVAMAGERLRLEGYPEMSGICTHPAHRGRGLARNLILYLAHHQRRAGLAPWLHVGTANRAAIDLYRELGFEIVRTIVLHRVVRTD